MALPWSSDLSAPSRTRRLFATRVWPIGAGSAAIAVGRVARAAAWAERRAGLVLIDAFRLHM